MSEPKLSSITHLVLNEQIQMRIYINHLTHLVCVLDELLCEFIQLEFLDKDRFTDSKF